MQVFEAATAAAPDADSRWYLIQCKPRQDARALENLQRQGFECYFPTLSVEKLRHGRKVAAIEALFPGYLFIQLRVGKDNWAPIRSTRGVNQMVRVRDQPVPVPAEIIDGIRQRLATQQPRPYLRPGERVLITDGCFSQLEAVFIANEGEHRVTLLLNILQQEHTLSFPVASVRRFASH
jgi:transcriptional antiterminator RfaH